MKNLLNEKVRNIEISGIRKILNKVAENPNIINLTFGQPDFQTPSYIKEAAKKALDDNYTGYTTNAGLIELRQAASDYQKKLYGLEYDPETEILVTTGASEAIDIAFETILTPGDEVLMPSPIYSGYEPVVKLRGGVPVFMDTNEQNFKITAELIEKHITEKTRCLILSSPSNPIGTILTKEEILDISNLLKDKNIFVLSDEVYSELIYDDEEHISIANVPEMREKTIVINALSKSHAMTGWRIGFTFAPAFLTEELLKVHSYIAVCANSISQVAATEALRQGVRTEEIELMKKSYKERRDYVYKRIKKMGLECVKPKGAFYIFPKIPKVGLTSAEFIEGMIDQVQVAAIPGDAFTSYGEGYIRLSYAQSIEDLKTGIDRMEQYVNTLTQE